MTRLLHYAIALSLVGLLPAYSSAQHAVKLVTERSTITQVSSTDQSGGEATQFTQQVLQRAGLGHELLYLPWRRAYNIVSSEPNVMIFPLARTDQREARFNWVGELIPVNYYLLRLKSRGDIQISTLDDAKQYRIGVVNYHVHHEYLAAQGFTELQPVNGNAQNLKKALLGRIDLFPISDLSMLPVCTRESIDCSQFEPVLKLEGISGGLYMAFGLATDDAIVETTRKAYRELVAEGTHGTIFRSRLEYASQFDAMWPMSSDPKREERQGKKKRGI